MKQPETKFKEKIVPKLKALSNVWLVKIQQRTIVGTPDILMCLGGLFVAIELKVDSKLTKLQEYNLTKIHEAGGIAMVLTPRNMEECLLYLETLSKGSVKYAKPSHIIM